jgi:NADH:ubiquinone oxidoreductase subunit 2 (subunit N)
MLLDTNNLLEFILLVETSSLIMCILCAISTTTIAAANSSIKHIEASLKLYIIGAFSSVFLLFGTSLIYGSTGCYNFEDISIITDTYLNTYFYPNYYDMSLSQKYFTPELLTVDLEEDKVLLDDSVYNFATTANALDVAYTDPISIFYDFNFSEYTALYINYNPQTVKGGSIIMSIGLLLGVIFIFIGFGFKLGIAPMHS